MSTSKQLLKATYSTNRPSDPSLPILLVVDDEKEIAVSVADLFRRTYRVLTATSGQEALELLKQHDVSVILADQRMPGMSGAEFLAQASSLNEDFVKILMTGYSDIQAVARAINEGKIFFYLTKPWRPEELSAVIAKAFAHSQLLQEKRKLARELVRINAGLEAQVVERTDAYRIINNNLQALIESMSDWAWEVDNEGRYTYCTPQVATVLGYSPDEMIGKTPFDFMAPDEAERVQRKFRELVSNRFPLRNLENWNVSKDGRKVLLSTSGVPMYDAAGNLTCYRGVDADITEHRRIKEELRRSNRALRAISDCNSALLHARDEREVLNEVCRIVVENGGYRQAWVGYAEHDEGKSICPVAQVGFEDGYLETLNLTWNDSERGRGPAGMTIRTGCHHLINDIFSDATFALWREQAKIRGYTSALFLPLKSDDHVFGTLNIYSGSQEGIDAQELILLMTLAENLAYGIGTLRAHKARQQAENDLQLSEERHRLLVNNALDIIWTLGPDLSFTFVSPAVERVTGFTPAEMREKALNEIFTPDSLAIVRTYLLGVGDHSGKPLPRDDFRSKLEQVRKDGSRVWVEATISPLRDTNGNIVELVGVTRDITETKRYEREQEDARAAAESANQLKSEFLANMSHEIRTPMNAIMGLAQLLEKGPLLSDQRSMVQHIRTAGQSLLSILNDILDLSKIEAGRLRIELRPFALQPLLEQIDSLLGYSARSKGVALRLQAPDLEGGLLGDDLRLEQILQNLVGNAIKFTEQGEVRVEIQPVETTDTNVRLRFQITDTGVGIAQEVQEYLFTPFTQADGSITRRFGGTGLGLSICKRLTELMEGTIGVQSREGEGSAFWFEIPFQRTNAPPPTKDATFQWKTGPRLTGRRILVVDDSELNRIVVTRALKMEEAETVTATNGEEALNILRNRPDAFDAVLMDVQMPIMDGLTATRLIRGELRLTTLPIIAFTAGAQREEQQKTEDAGLDDILLKPVDLEEMVTVLLHWLCSSSEESMTATKRERPVFGLPSGTDVARGLANQDNNENAYREFLGELVRIHGDDADRIRAAVTAGDFTGAAKIAHMLKGVAGNLAADEVFQAISELELVLKRGQEALIERHLMRLTEALKELRRLVLLMREEPRIHTHTDYLPLPEPGNIFPLMDELSQLLHQQCMDALDVMNNLEERLACTIVAEDAALLGEAVSRLEFDTARNMVAGLAQHLTELMPHQPRHDQLGGLP
jgi:PAS domain S-box-containing protein